MRIYVILYFVGPHFFQHYIAEGYKSSFTNCHYAYTLKLSDWAGWNNGTNPYHLIYRKWILELLSLAYPLLVFVTLQSLVLYRMVKVPELRREFKYTWLCLFFIGILVFVPDLIDFLLISIPHEIDFLFDLGWRLTFSIECANFLMIFVFLLCDFEFRGYFCQLYITASMRDRLYRVANWLRTRTFRHKQFENERQPENDSEKYGNDL